MNGRYAIMENIAAPGTATPMHFHAEDEIFHVLEGTVTFSIDDGVAVSIDLSGADRREGAGPRGAGIVGYRAKRHIAIIEVERCGLRMDIPLRARACTRARDPAGGNALDAKGVCANEHDPGAGSFEGAGREALAQRLAEYVGQRPGDVSRLVQLEDQVKEADAEINEILKRTPAELAYNQALERSITFHKDLEFLIASITKRRNEALEMLERYRQGLGKQVEQVIEDILDAEYKVVESQEVEKLSQVAPLLVPPARPEAEEEKATASANTGRDENEVAP